MVVVTGREVVVTIGVVVVIVEVLMLVVVLELDGRTLVVKVVLEVVATLVFVVDDTEAEAEVVLLEPPLGVAVTGGLGPEGVP